MVLSLLTPVLYAQYAQITFTSGGEFTITSGGRRTVYQGLGADSGALILRRDDTIQTGKGSFVELRLEPGGTRIKIAENTSLTCKGPGSEVLSTSFLLSYGRIRVSSAGVWPQGQGNAVFVRVGQMEAVFRQGDAGVDYIANPDGTGLSRSEPVLTAYNFNGNLELRPYPAQGSTGGITVNERESLSMETANSMSFIERKQLEEWIINYWNRYNFSEGMPLLAPKPAASASASPAAAGAEGISPQVTVIQINGDGTPQSGERSEHTVSPVTTVVYAYPHSTYDRRLFRAKNFLLATGMFFTAAGVGVQIAGASGVPGLEPTQNKVLFNLGYVPMVLGLIFNGAALVINPPNMEKDAPD